MLPPLWRRYPKRATATVDLIETVIELPELGKVRFICRRLSSRKGKTRPLVLDGGECCPGGVKLGSFVESRFTSRCGTSLVASLSSRASA